ncbi:MAG: hypothetical protein AAF718_05740 [Pseudomonadota bacterium]
MPLKNCIILGSILLLASGCAGVRERVFGGGGQSDRALPFRTNLTKGEDRRDIAVRVRAGGVAVSDVRESVRFAATRYCLTTFGGADTLWALDPATGDWAFSRDGQDMIFEGRCVAR